MPTSKAFHYYFKSLRYNQMKIYAGCSFEAHSTVLHSHEDFYEIILITNGSYQHTINGITTTIPQNTLLLFTPGAVHQMFSEPLQAIHFVICVEQNYFEQFVAQHFPDFHLDEHTNFYSKTISRERAQYIESLGKTICRSNEPPVYLADEITFLTLSDFAHHSPDADLSTYICEIITKLDNLVYVNMSIPEICSNFHYSQNQILKAFKEMTGYTMVEYKKNQKLKYACKLLKTTDIKIIDIAIALHYNSLPYFLRAFKEVYGMTPSDYRKKYHE